MKKIISAAYFVVIWFSANAMQVIYSHDGITSGSTIRECPSQGVSRSTGNVIVGLHALTDLQRMDCGWYRVVQTANPDTNHIWIATNYTFTAEGTASPIWVERKQKIRAAKYSKYAIIVRLESVEAEGGSNKWDVVKGVLEQSKLMDKWNSCTYISADDVNFIAIKSHIQATLGLTEKELAAWLENCKY